MRRLRHQYCPLQYACRVPTRSYANADGPKGNHTAYKQVKGTKTSPEQMLELYEGLQQSSLNDFDILLTGYMPSAQAVQAVGKIGRDIKFNAATKPGSFFWGMLAGARKGCGS